MPKSKPQLEAGTAIFKENLAYIALGANLGQPRETLRWAVERLALLGRVEAVSRLYRTAPVGGPAGQPDYFNAALRLRTGLGPLPLLEAMHAIEARAGRVREVRWAARTLDLDLIVYQSFAQAGVMQAEAEPSSVVQDTPRLTLPHPRAWQRGFVLAPLRDLEPMLRHPVSGQTVSEALEALEKYASKEYGPDKVAEVLRGEAGWLERT